nr:60s ribosomal protein l18a-like protein [Quercus suber]
MGLDKASGLPHEIESMETDEIAGGVTMGEIEIMAAWNRGDDSDDAEVSTEPDPISDEGDDSGAEESWLGTDWVLSDNGGRTPRCMPDAGTGPSHTAGHEGTFLAQTTSCGASTDYEDPPCMSPSVFSGSAHDGGCIFVPTPGMPTPPLVHVEPTMATSSPTPHEEAVQIEQIPAEDIEPVEAFRRSRSPPTHAPDCGIGDGKIRHVGAYGQKQKRSLNGLLGTFILLCARVDYREKLGYIACTIASTLVVIAVMLGVTRRAHGHDCIKHGSGMEKPHGSLLLDIHPSFADAMPLPNNTQPCSAVDDLDNTEVLGATQTHDVGGFTHAYEHVQAYMDRGLDIDVSRDVYEEFINTDGPVDEAEVLDGTQIENNEEDSPTIVPILEWFTSNTWDNINDPSPALGTGQLTSWHKGDQPTKGMLFQNKASSLTPIGW